MKNLILIRHAKSDWNAGVATDYERPLDERGVKEAHKMAKRLAEKEIMPDLIITSSAIRALTTCKFIAEKLDYSENNIRQSKLLYSGNTGVWMDTISEIDNSNHTVMMFGHNPVISNLASHLVNRDIGEMPTCAVVAIQLNIESWQDISNPGSNQLSFIDYPKNKK